MQKSHFWVLGLNHSREEYAEIPEGMSISEFMLEKGNMNNIESWLAISMIKGIGLTLTHILLFGCRIQ